MKNIFYFILLAASASLMFSSCASVSGFEEGRALGEGGREMIVSANYISLPGSLDVLDDDDEIGLPSSFGFPNIDISYKQGLTDKLDVGGRITTNLNAGAFVKYQLVGDDMSKFALGTGLEIASTLGILYNMQVPINTTYYVSDAVAINLAPRFIYQFAAGSFDSSITYLGGNFGLLFGRKNKFGLDIGYYNVSAGGNILTVGFGGKFRFGT